MFGTFLLFVLYFIVSIGVLVCLGISIVLMLKAKNELTQPKELVDLVKDPMLFLNESEFTDEGNQYRQQFLQFLGVSAGLIILLALLNFMLG